MKQIHLLVSKNTYTTQKSKLLSSKTLINIDILKTIELDFAVMQLREDGIVTFFPSADFLKFGPKQIEQVYQTVLSLTNNTPSPLFVDIKNHFTLTSEEKNLISIKLSSCLTACAIKEDNVLIRFVVHTFNYMYKPEVPIKMFKTKEEAILWLKEF